MSPLTAATHQTPSVTNRDLSGKNYYYFFNKVCLDQIAIPKGVELKNRMNDSPTALGFNEEQ